ncbi:hypothetical protein H2200_002794 [Cladophialophora chaetospira]|uniref:Clr5 domain-containing protein n=1 Tax=Cladophialophora chaetospira TaxID=386627 RepID=A0AA38XJJ6_9EURO|nr:hypothetical protein H2200_002794 [Cladophialophora chaetospira]
MTLQDVIQKLDRDYDFHATEQMFKKRINTWGLSKNIKAEEKEQALAQILHKAPSTTGPIPIRHDKLVRYAKTRAKLGELDGRDLSRIVKVKREEHDESRQLISKHSAQRNTLETPSTHSTKGTAYLPQSLALPDGHAGFDMFLRAMKALIQKEKGEWRLGPQGPPDAIFNELSAGIASWRNKAFPAARRSFGQAARGVNDDIQTNQLSVSRITYCISSITWFSGREPVFQMFAEFMANAALEVLGQTNPLTIVLRYLRAPQSLGAQLAIWACAVDGNPISEQNVDHWWGMVRRRWRWCCRCGMNDLAAQYCHEAVFEARRINKLTQKMESEALHDLATVISATSPEQAPEKG